MHHENFLIYGTNVLRALRITSQPSACSQQTSETLCLNWKMFMANQLYA